jgi:hypothetical protein
MSHRSIEELAAEYVLLKSEPDSWGATYKAEAALHAWSLYQEILRRCGDDHAHDHIKRAFEIREMIFGEEIATFKWYVGLSIQNIKRELTNDWSSKDHR